MNRLKPKVSIFRWYYRRRMFFTRTDKDMDRIKIRKRNGRDFRLIGSSTKAAYFNTSNGFTSSRFNVPFRTGSAINDLSVTTVVELDIYCKIILIKSSAD